MAEEKWVTVKIGGYPRRAPESKLPQIQQQAKEMIKEFAEKGISREKLEELFSIEIVKDEE